MCMKGGERNTWTSMKQLLPTQKEVQRFSSLQVERKHRKRAWTKGMQMGWRKALHFVCDDRAHVTSQNVKPHSLKGVTPPPQWGWVLSCKCVKLLCMNNLFTSSLLLYSTLSLICVAPRFTAFTHPHTFSIRFTLLLLTVVARWIHLQVDVKLEYECSQKEMHINPWTRLTWRLGTETRIRVLVQKRDQPLR